MQRLYRWVLAACAGSTAAGGLAQVAAAPPPPPPPSKFEGALGLVVAQAPAFSGSSDRKVKLEPAGFLRWGRFTLTGAGGFTTRAQRDVERGLDALLVDRKTLRINLSLRFDGGRRESASAQLRGLGDIDPTVRARLGLAWDFAPGWSFGVSSSLDALGRAGGYVVNAGLSHSMPIDERQRWVFSASASGAGDRWMQTWYGVTPAQSAASGYPAYAAGEGMRDVGIGATWRIEIDPHWAGFVGASASRLVGPAAKSPLALQRNARGVSAGLVRRF